MTVFTTNAGGEMTVTPVTPAALRAAVARSAVPSAEAAVAAAAAALAAESVETVAVMCTEAAATATLIWLASKLMAAAIASAMAVSTDSSNAATSPDATSVICSTWDATIVAPGGAWGMGGRRWQKGGSMRRQRRWRQLGAR